VAESVIRPSEDRAGRKRKPANRPRGDLLKKRGEDKGRDKAYKAGSSSEKGDRLLERGQTKKRRHIRERGESSTYAERWGFPLGG